MLDDGSADTFLRTKIFAPFREMRSAHFARILECVKSLHKGRRRRVRGFALKFFVRPRERGARRDEASIQDDTIAVVTALFPYRQRYSHVFPFGEHHDSTRSRREEETRREENRSVAKFLSQPKDE